MTKLEELTPHEIEVLESIRTNLEQMFDSEHRIDMAMEDYTKMLIANRNLKT